MNLCKNQSMEDFVNFFLYTALSTLLVAVVDYDYTLNLPSGKDVAPTKMTTMSTTPAVFITQQ